MPNLKTDDKGTQLQADKRYVFDFDTMAFRRQPKGPFTASHIKLMRLGYGTEKPEVLKQVKDAAACTPDTLQLAVTILRLHVRV